MSSVKSVVRENNKQKNERKSMNNKLDEPARGLAQSTTRPQALKNSASPQGVAFSVTFVSTEAVPGVRLSG